MAFWGAFAILVVAVAGGIAFAALRGWQLFTTARHLQRAVGPELERISEVTLQIEHHMRQADAATGRLQDAAGRLAVSRERLQIQLAAVREARAQVRRVFWFVPGV